MQVIKQLTYQNLMVEQTIAPSIALQNKITPPHALLTNLFTDSYTSGLISVEKLGRFCISISPNSRRNVHRGSCAGSSVRAALRSPRKIHAVSAFKNYKIFERTTITTITTNK